MSDRCDGGEGGSFCLIERARGEGPSVDALRRSAVAHRRETDVREERSARGMRIRSVVFALDFKGLSRRMFERSDVAARR
jgi:hypothetical protein